MFTWHAWQVRIPGILWLKVVRGVCCIRWWKVHQRVSVVCRKMNPFFFFFFNKEYIHVKSINTCIFIWKRPKIHECILFIWYTVYRDYDLRTNIDLILFCFIYLFTFPLCLQFHTEAYTLPDPEKARLATRRHQHCSDCLTYRASPCVILYFSIFTEENKT